MSRLMSILEVDLGKENLDTSGQKLDDSPHMTLDEPSDSVQNALLL